MSDAGALLTVLLVVLGAVGLAGYVRACTALLERGEMGRGDLSRRPVASLTMSGGLLPATPFRHHTRRTFRAAPLRGQGSQGVSTSRWPRA